jgi:hypothetical protein
MMNAKSAIDYYHGLLRRLKNTSISVHSWIYKNLFDEAELDDSLSFCVDFAAAKNLSLTAILLELVRKVYKLESWFNGKFSKKEN